MNVSKHPQSIQDRLISLISWKLNVPSSRIYPYTKLRDDLQLDPIDLLLLIADIEHSFNVYLTPEEADAIETIEDANFFIEKHGIAA